MFAISKEYLLHFLRLKQRSSCQYDMYSINKSSNAPAICDCKYGWDGEQGYAHDEKSGCPELRLAHLLFSVMTDEEYNTLLKRAGCL